MKRAIMAVLFLIGRLAAWSDSDLVAQCDRLIAEGKTAECFSLLNTALPMATTSREKAAVKWLLSRTVFWATLKSSQEKAARDDLLREYEKGAALASEAVALDSGSGEAYLWRASNWASWAQTDGGLGGLGKVGLIKDDLAAAMRINPALARSYYILGLLYANLPGWPISFGDKEFGISLLRKAIDTVTAEKDAFGMSMYLTTCLWERNRNREDRAARWKGLAGEYARRIETAEKFCFYEGSIDGSAIPVYADRPLGELSDREEARAIVAYLEKRVQETVSDAADRTKFLETINQVKKKMK